MADISENGLEFDLPKNKSSAIKVIGVGGGGSNAVNHMKAMGIKGVDFIVCNTDAQALEHSPVENRIQLGQNLTEGLGAGANPDVGRQAGEESREIVRELLRNNTRMVFITAGMGGGTGTGAAPVIARCAKELGILTVGIVTKPFGFEGKVRMKQALEGIELLRQQVDSLVVINNDKLREVYGNLSFRSGFAKADEVLATAAKGIAEVITYHYTTNIDLRDVRTVLENSGTAILGSARAGGEKRAEEAVLGALDSPLLNDNHIHGAKNVLLLIVSGNGDQEITMDEMSYINEHIQDQAGGSANVIMGIGIDDRLENEISVTLIATGFPSNQHAALSGKAPEKIVHPLEEDQTIERNIFQKSFADLKNETKAPAPKPFAPKQPDLFSEPTVKAEAVVYNLDDEAEEDALFVVHSDETSVPAYEVTDVPIVQAAEPVAVVNEISISTEAEPLPAIKPIVAADFENADLTLSIVIDDNIDEEDDFTFVPPTPTAPTLAEEAPIASMEWNTGKEEMSFELDDIEGEGMYITTMPSNTANEITETEAEIDPFDFKIEEVFGGKISEPADTFEPVAQQLSPATEKPVNTPDGRVIHTLEDFRALEERLQIKETPTKTVTVVAEEAADTMLAFKVNRVEQPMAEIATKNEDLLEQPLSAVSRQKIMERKSRLQAFNYHFKEHKTMAMAQEPAYKRQGLDVGTDKHSSASNVSRMSISGQGNDVEIRTNNSFLHDNVD